MWSDALNADTNIKEWKCIFFASMLSVESPLYFRLKAPSRQNVSSNDNCVSMGSGMDVRDAWWMRAESINSHTHTNDILYSFFNIPEMIYIAIITDLMYWDQSQWKFISVWVQQRFINVEILQEKNDVLNR